MKRVSVRLISFVKYIPQFVWNMLRDKDVSYTSKVLFVSAIVYILFPLDLIPDFILGLGFTDDIAAFVIMVQQVVKYINLKRKRKAYVVS